MFIYCVCLLGLQATFAKGLSHSMSIGLSQGLGEQQGRELEATFAEVVVELPFSRLVQVIVAVSC